LTQRIHLQIIARHLDGVNASHVNILETRAPILSIA